MIVKGGHEWRTTADKIMVGGRQVSAIYRGTTQIYPDAPPPIRLADDVQMLLGWTNAIRTIDLDTAAFFLTKTNGLYRTVAWNQRNYGNIAVLDRDDTTGTYRLNNEHLTIHLSNMPSNIYKVVLAMHVYTTGPRISSAQDAFVRIISLNEPYIYYLRMLKRDYGDYYGLILGEFARKGDTNEWVWKTKDIPITYRVTYSYILSFYK